MEQTNMQSPATPMLPQKSATWVGANIGAAVLIINILIRVFDNYVIAPLFTDQTTHTVVSLVLTLVGVWLGVKFGVSYAAKRTSIDLSKISTISLVAAVIPLVFALFWVVLGMFIAQSAAVTPKFPFLGLIVPIIVGIVIYFLTQYSLRKSYSYNKGLMWIVGLLAIVVIGITGYRFFNKAQDFRDTEARQKEQVGKLIEGLGIEESGSGSNLSLYDEAIKENKPVQLPPNFPKELNLDNSARLTYFPPDNNPKTEKAYYITKKSFEELVAAYDSYFQNNASKPTREVDPNLGTTDYKGETNLYNYTISVGKLIDDSGQFISIETTYK
jgi:hypothetical protein